MTLAVFTDPERLADWDWTKWLPHGADPQSGTSRLVAVGPEQSDTLARGLLSAAPRRTEGGAGPVLLVVVDGATLLEGRPCPLRDLLADRTLRCGALVLTTRLPALCTSVVTAAPEGRGGCVTWPPTRWCRTYCSAVCRSTRRAPPPGHWPASRTRSYGSRARGCLTVSPCCRCWT
ncbi:hypothetical protein SAZ11_11030 [Streptomyces sp. FXJ1.4098]|nr:hypothetical protein [Streptomyces sp. FXJ1.4098]